MKNIFLENTYFSLSTPSKPFREELPNITSMWGNTIRPLNPMKGVMSANEKRISNSNMLEDDKAQLIDFLQDANRDGNERVAEKVNAVAIVGSMVAGTAVANLVLGDERLGLPKFVSGFDSVIAGFGFAPMASKIIEKPLRFVVDAIRGAKQESDTRRFLDSEGIK